MKPPASILVVDDDPEMLNALTGTLERAGYTVTGQSRADRALEFLQTTGQTFDLVITDVAMPGLKGLPFLTAMKTAFPARPVIVITAFGDWEQYARALGEGAFAFLCKPVAKAELLSTVARALSGQSPVGSSTTLPWDGF